MVTVAMESWVMEDDGDGGANGEIWWFGWDERGGADWCGTRATGGAAVGVGEEDGDDGERETRGDGYGGDEVVVW
ncbi:hypothetical protein F0562_030795 [Nyssa sinensis]|uniref:Uncharacterized protein n=1 Tax=Nyssa sinensis TaxID=561372 RepID=A0A5J5AZF2_9ASTE|nr:hypothetical protein F0562_030795 [Nyssa sinensis]